MTAISSPVTTINRPVWAPSTTAPQPAYWACDHPGIGVLPYADERAARIAAGTAAAVLCRSTTDDAWALAPDQV